MSKSYEKLLHRSATFIGGFAAMYTLMIFMNLGSSMTVNILDIVKGLMGRNFLEAALHFLGMVIYGASVFAAVYLSKKGKIDVRLTSALLSAVCFVIMALIPDTVDHCVGLYPCFIMMSFQWVAYGNLGGYTSAPIFSTNNYRQTIGALAEYAADKDPAHLEKARFFAGTLAVFYLAASVSYFTCEIFGQKAAYFGLIPCAVLALICLRPKLQAVIMRAHAISAAK